MHTQRKQFFLSSWTDQLTDRSNLVVNLELLKCYMDELFQVRIHMFKNTLLRYAVEQLMVQGTGR